MKKLLLILAAAVVPALLCAQQSDMDKLMKKYEDRTGMTIVNLEGNIFEGIKHFLESGDDDNTSSPFGWEYGDNELNDEVILFAPPVVEEGESTDEEVDYYAEYSDYDFGDNDDYDYGYGSNFGSSFGSDYGDFLGGFQEYLDGLSSVKVMIYKDYIKKFPKDIRKIVVSKKPYRNVLSTNSDGKRIRIYTIEDDNGNGRCETLAIIGEDTEYIIINIVGKGDYFTPLFELLKSKI